MSRIIYAFLFCLSLFTGSIFAQTTSTDKTETESSGKVVKKANKRPAEDNKRAEPFDKTDVKTMASKCVALNTEKGTIRLEMYPESAPETVRSFLNLVAAGALDTTTFSRVVPDFIIQGGDLYTSKKLTDVLRWRAVKMLADEPNQIRHEIGIISMARGDEANSASTNFFILLTTASYLDNKFAGFGKVIEGLEVVQTINKMSVENEAPKEPVRITTANIEACPTPAVSESQ